MRWLLVFWWAWPKHAMSILGFYNISRLKKPNSCFASGRDIKGFWAVAHRVSCTKILLARTADSLARHLKKCILYWILCLGQKMNLPTGQVADKIYLPVWILNLPRATGQPSMSHPAAWSLARRIQGSQYSHYSLIVFVKIIPCPFILLLNKERIYLRNVVKYNKVHGLPPLEMQSFAIPQISQFFFCRYVNYGIMSKILTSDDVTMNVDF